MDGKRANQLSEQRRSIIWAHGSGLFTVTPTTNVTRLETAASVTPAASTFLHHPHFVQITVATPALLDNHHLNIVKAFLRFRTGDDAQITQIRLYDAELQFAVFYGPLKNYVFKDIALTLKHPHRVVHGILFSIEVCFYGPGQNWVEISCAGVEILSDGLASHPSADEEVAE